jgi:hypothetical protein
MEQEMQQAIETTKDFMQHHKIDAETMSYIGDVAQKSIENKKIYPELRKYLISRRVFDKNQLSEEPNYMVLVALSAMGKLAREM